MKVRELLDRISDNTNVRIINIKVLEDDNGGVVAVYDGKNSIDESFGNYEVENFEINGDLVTIFINQFVDDKLMATIASYMSDDCRETAYNVFRDDLTNEEWLQSYMNCCCYGIVDGDKDFLEIMNNEFSGVMEELEIW